MHTHIHMPTAVLEPGEEDYIVISEWARIWLQPDYYCWDTESHSHSLSVMLDCSIAPFAFRLYSQRLCTFRQQRCRIAAAAAVCSPTRPVSHPPYQPRNHLKSTVFKSTSKKLEIMISLLSFSLQSNNIVRSALLTLQSSFYYLCDMISGVFTSTVLQLQYACILCVYVCWSMH